MDGKNEMKKGFIPQRGYYQNLKVYQLGNCIYALTYAFAHRHLEIGDRTKDQMIQAARTGLIESQKRRFLQEGGIKEQMYKARMESRANRSSRES